MQVKLTDSGEVQFLDGDHINRNSLNRKALIVTPETALATRESLWVQFGDSQNFEDVNANILEPIRLTEEADGYRTIFPDEVVKKAGVWYMTLAVRMYSTDGTTFSEQLTSDKVSFTVNDSYPMGDNGYISNGTLENAWQQIEAAVQDAAGSADEAEQSAMNAEAAQTAAEAAQSAAETAQGKAEDAQAAAEEAESGAQTQAQAAASSATAAEESAVQAQTNAGEASASATAAAESAAAASGSESAAAEAAGSASKSAEEAATSAGEAASSASLAQAAQAAAETAKESVEASADAAAKSAESARASATAAGNSATAAAGSAGDAESAKAAAQTAQNAAESAEGNAQAYAGQASGSASAASQSEINARAYMEQAKQYAQKEYQVVASFDDLPRPGDSAYIYLVPSGSGSSNDHYSEYLWISEANDYEFVGAINEVDLSGYAQTNGTYPNMTVGNASNAASAQTAVKATQDAAGNDIAASYAKQTGTYPNMSVGTASEAAYADAAASADTAGYATTAKGDASGNDIEATYAKQTGTYAGMTVGNATQAGSANDPNAVHFTAQTLTDEQKAQARTNIGAADAGTVATNTSDIADLESDVQKIIDGTTSVAEAAHADTADSATKAAQDAAGNVIADTYAKQQGSYPQMSVGNASNATLASNSNMLGGVAADSYALKQNSNGGFEGGDGASSTGNGAAVGADASSASGFAGGYNSSASGGGSAGNSAMTTNGGAVGSGTSSTSGFAGGSGSNTTTGVAIGTSAVASGTGAVQLGTGTNSTSNTLQFRDYQLVDADGKIPDDRISDTFVKGSDLFSSSGEIILAEKLPSTVWGIPQTGLYTNYTFPSSGSSITPSRDGYFLISKRSGEAGQWLSVKQGYMTQVAAGSSDRSECGIVLPVVKSVPINIFYTLTGESIRCMLVWTVSFG